MLALSGCSFFEIKDQAVKLSNIAQINGNVVNKSHQTGRIILVVFRKENQLLIKIGSSIAPEDGKFSLNVRPGSYLVMAYIDSNKNYKYDDGEYGKSYTGDDAVQLDANQKIVLPAIVIKGLPEVATQNINLTSEKNGPYQKIGVIVNLSDPELAEENYSLGMWRPLEFINKIGGGVFLLEPYDKKRLPVLFVHGIGGGPANFSDFIKSMNHEKYQAILMYYPSGLKLGAISDYMATAVAKLQYEHRFDKIVVVAHSMGGLVTRSFLKKYYERYPHNAPVIKLVLTINSPIAGIGALKNVNDLPFALPVWYDLAPNSDFINEILSWKMPETINYHLIFSFADGEDSDGVVKIKSQLPYNVQSEASRIYGFNTSHIGPLHDTKILNVLNDIIMQNVSD